MNELSFDGKSALELYSDAIKKRKQNRNNDWYPFITDMEFISKDMKYYTSILSLLKPYINYPSREGNTYIQTLEDIRYLNVASILFQLHYNCWDRIGDFLDNYVETGLSPKSVYFTTVLKELTKRHEQCDALRELNSLFNNCLGELLSNRKTIVHYTQISGRMFSQTMLNLHDDKLLLELETEKSGYPSFFVQHLEYAHDGFRLACKIVSELAELVVSK